jgi:hypothetical protein
MGSIIDPYADYTNFIVAARNFAGRDLFAPARRRTIM